MEDYTALVKTLRYLATELSCSDCPLAEECQGIPFCCFGNAARVIEELSVNPAADVRPVVRGKNIGIEYDECDQFVCSKCGIELQDWHRVERDEDNGDVTYHEYVFSYCPNCGADMREAE